MLWMRSSPQPGIQRVFAMAESACSRSVGVPASRAMNHWYVARKMIGFLQRQQTGYECVSLPAARRYPRSRMNSTIFGFASKTRSPAKCATSGRKRPPSSTGQ